MGHRLAMAERGRADRKPAFEQCVVLWMSGGPSHVDTFIPSAQLAKKTSIDDMPFGPAMDALANHAADLCVLKCVGSREGEHERATSLLHTGFSPSPSFPRPSFGSMVSETRRDDGFPNYVTLGGRSFGPAFLGTQNGPFVINDTAEAKTQIERLKSRNSALELLHQLNENFDKQSPAAKAAAVHERNASVESVRRLLATDFGSALDLDFASSQQKQSYGSDEFGQRLLAARRLLEIGVPIVEVQLDGWDTHVQNDRSVKRLSDRLVPPWIALMKDLKSSGDWDKTLLVWLGEFGRTPTINGRGGRDHFPEIIPVVLAGGNLGGHVIGEVNDSASERVGVRHNVADLMATLLAMLGLNLDHEYTTDFGSPTTVTDDGTPIAGVMQLV